MSNNDTGTVLLALLTGAALGAGAGILFAPQKGSRTRRKIKKNVRKAQREMASRIQSAAEEINLTARDRRQVFERELDEALSNMSYKAEDLIETLEHKLAELKAENSKYQKHTGSAAVK